MSDETRASDHRPSPEALLVVAQKESRGRLKIFLGAAPGVGKTYEMLQTGRARLREGADVVVAVVETHGRAETEVLLEGFEILPRRHVVHNGQTLEEMDLDALLDRRPGLALVDELAHTNAPGSRHPKRYMDVEELLAAGIDVFTTLNIQHVESLNDVVAQITRIRVRETVPDSIIDRADEIELIDLTPADLIKRLQDGKIYLPKTATRALDHFFSPGNLTALRELALRRTAQRVDDQLLTHMQAHAISGPWAAGERVLVCISEDPRSTALVRYGKRVADRLRGPWTAIYIETPRTQQLGEEARDRIAAALRLATSLGGEASVQPSAGRRIADDLLDYARAHNANHIVIGKSDRSRWFEILNGSVVHDLVRRSGAISVHVIAGERLQEGTGKAPREPVQSVRRHAGWRSYVASLASVAVGLGLAKLGFPYIGVENVDLVLLISAVGVAGRLGIGPSITAVAAASLAYNFFFLPPLYTLTIADPKNIVALICFAVVAILVSHLSVRAQAQAATARARARTTDALYLFSRKLAGVGTLDDVLWVTAYQIASMLRVRVVLLLPDEERGISVRAGYPPEDRLNPPELAAAQWAFERNHEAGRGADTLPGGRWLFLPMRTNRGAVGVAGIDSDKAGALLMPDERRLLDALIDQAALAIERVHLVEDLDRAKYAAERDRLRTALLTSISHDLKTPLSLVMGAAETLKSFGPSLDDAARADLLGTILDEGERLNRFIANLLDMTKLESGAIVPKTTPCDIGELIGSALRRAAKILAAHRTQVEVAPNLPMPVLDPVLFEQVLFNLLDNAAKYAPAGTLVVVRSWADSRSVHVQIEDEGEGIPPGDFERIFDKFYRVQKEDHVRAGTGLGLAICRGFVEAMGGTITAANRTDGAGAVFTITLPLSYREDIGAAPATDAL